MWCDATSADVTTRYTNSMTAETTATATSSSASATSQQPKTVTAVATATLSPNSTKDSTSNSDHSTISKGAVAGIAVGAAATITVVAFTLFCCWLRPRLRRAEHKEITPDPNSPYIMEKRRNESGNIQSATSADEFVVGLGINRPKSSGTQQSIQQTPPPVYQPSNLSATSATKQSGVVNSSPLISELDSQPLSPALTVNTTGGSISPAINGAYEMPSITVTNSTPTNRSSVFELADTGSAAKPNVAYRPYRSPYGDNASSSPELPERR